MTVALESPDFCKTAGTDMNYANTHVVYVDSRVSHGLDGNHVCKSSSADEVEATGVRDDSLERNQDCLEAILDEIDEVRTSLRNILSVFDGGEFWSKP